MQPAPLHNGKTLFHLIAAGDEEAFRALFDHYRADLYRVALQLTKSSLIAEETTQEVFVGLWVSRAKLPAVEDPDGYIYRILLNSISRYLHKDNQQRIIRDALARREQAGNPTQERVDANESLRLINNAINQLPPQQKAVYQLSRQQGWSMNEIAHHLNISPLTAKSYLRDASRFIRTYLQDVAMIAGLLAIWQK